MRKNSVIALLLLLFSCSGGTNKINGRWSLIKRISPQGNVVDGSSPFNFYENYVIDFNSDGKTLRIEYDSKSFGGRHGLTHHEKGGEYRLEKNDSNESPYLLTLRVNNEGAVEETANKVRTLSDNELIYAAPDGFTWYFERK